MANRFLSNIRINDAYTFPASDGTNGQVIITDGAGNLSFADQSGGAATGASIQRDNFVGDGSTTVFYLGKALSDEDQSQVYIDGVYQEKDTYDVTDNTLTFTIAPEAGHSVEVISIYGISIGPTIIYQDNFTGDGTSVDFTLGQLVDDEIKTFVFLNGVYQFKGTYLVNGTTLTFDAAPSNGTAIEVVTIASAASESYNQTLLFYGKFTEAVSKGDAIMFAGVEGDHFLLSKATQAALAVNHEYFLGLASQDSGIGEFGYVTEFGRVDQIDTTIWTAGDVLWFDSEGSTAGALINTEPAPPNTKIQVAAVIREHQTQGVLFVRPTTYHELGELHDVNITSVADKDMLVWDNANGYWENSKTLGDITVGTLTATSVGGTLSTAAQPNITSIGTLSSLNISSTSVYQLTVKSTGAQYILVGSTDANSAGIILDGNSNGDGTGGDYSYIVHDTTGALKITQDSIAGTNEVWLGTSGTEGKVILDADGRLLVGSTSGRGGTTTGHIFKMPTGDSYFEIMANSTSGFSDILFSDGNTGAYGLFGYDHSTESIRLYTNSSEKLRVDSNGNLGIGTSSPSEKLTVNGNINFPYSTAGVAYFGIEPSPTNPFATNAKELVIRGANAYTAGTPTQAQAGGDVYIKGGLAIVNTGLGVYAGDVSIEGGETHDSTESGAGKITFKTAGLERMRITSGGSVLIGTTSTVGSRKLVIDGSSSGAIYTKGIAGSANVIHEGGHIEFYNQAAVTRAASIGLSGPASGATNDMVFNTYNGSWAERMRITDGSGIIFNSLLYFSANNNNTLNSGFNNPADDNDMWINYRGYNDGFSYYRDFRVGNGRGAQIIFVDGSASSVYVSGTFGASGSKNFKIDHPLESKKDTHYLVHAAIESPQVNNLYRGNISLVNGYAEVNIDETCGMTEGTFTALNTNPDIVVSNKTGWDPVKSEIENNIIKIYCKNTESVDTITWMVIAERIDDAIFNAENTNEAGKLIVEPIKTEEDIKNMNPTMD